MILDIHSHKLAPQVDAILNLPVAEFNPMDGQLYSIGIHPWSLMPDQDKFTFQQVEHIACYESVVAIGETGIDLAKEVPLFEQMLMFRKHVQLSERLKKPMILHCVKAHDIIASLRREMKPSMDWVIHGFRGKPTVAKILLQSGCSLSFGEHFNPESLLITPLDHLYAETDESEKTINEIINTLSLSRDIDLMPIITNNIQKFLVNPSSL